MVPVAAQERISSVDMIRGVAVLGILLMNILSFGLPFGYDDPTISGGGGINHDVFFWNTVLFEGKMRAIFSMLFGAGLVIMTARAESRRSDAQFADIYLRRNLWLTLIGLIHAYFIWEGDILYMYGLCGLILYTLRNLPARTLLISGVLLLAILMPKAWLDAFDMDVKRTAAMKAEAAKAQGAKLTPEQDAAIGVWKEKMKERKPPPEEVQKSAKAYLGDYWTVFLHRHLGVAHWQSTGFYLWAFWDVIGMMLLGMGLMKLGVFSADRDQRFYATIATLGLATGLGLTYWVTQQRAASGYEIMVSAYSGIAYEPARTLAGVGYVALLAWIIRLGFRSRALAAVGQMALTNYLLASVLASTFFYGYGFAMFNKLERYQLYFVVAAIWTIQLTLSPLWLKSYRFGPVEWLWRSLTYWELQPMRNALPLHLGSLEVDKQTQSAS